MGNEKRCVVNVSSHGPYMTGQKRLVDSLLQHGWPRSSIMTWPDAQPGCPTHATSNYWFKPWAVRQAAAAGFTSVLWVDSWMYAVRGIEPAFEYIESNEVLLMQRQEGMLGALSSDGVLAHYGVSRDDAMSVPLVATGLTGFDLSKPGPRDLLAGWQAASDAGQFHYAQINAINRGKMKGREGAGRLVERVSDDPRCLGHSGDEPSMTILAMRAGYKLVHWGVFAQCPGEDNGVDLPCFLYSGL